MTLVRGGTESIARRISGGEVFDLVVIAGPSIDQLMGEDRIAQRGRTDFAKSGVGVAVRSGLPRPDMGFQQISELLHVRGIDYLGPLPADIQNTTVYAIGLHALAPAPDAARELVGALIAPEAGSILGKAGSDAP